MGDQLVGRFRFLTMPTAMVRSAEDKTLERGRARPRDGPHLGRLFRPGAHLGSLQNHWGAALLFAIGVGALLWPVLVGARVLLPSSVLYFIPPWTTQKPPGVNSYFNPVLSDIPTAYYPWWSYARDSLRAWSVPQWNPYSLGGTPFYANAQTAFFSPFSLPLWLLPYKYAFGVAAAMRLWVTAFGTYLLCRELRLGFWPSVLAGLAFGFSAFSILWLSYPVLNVLALLPWALWLGARILRTGAASDALMLALVLALALLGGHPGSELHLYAILAVYVLVSAAVCASPVRDRLLRLALVGIAMVLGAALTAFVLLPVAQAIPGTVGVEARSGSALSIPWSAMRTLFFPDWWGRPSGIFLGGPFNYNERTVYTGAVIFLLALATLLLRSRWRSTAPFVVLGLIGFEAAFGLEPVRSIVDHLPVLSNDRNARLSLLIQLSTAVLAAFAFEMLLARPPTRASLVVVFVGAAVVIAGGLLATHASFQEMRTALHHFRTGDDFARAGVIELVSVGWWALLALLLLAALLARRTIGPAAFGAAVFGLMVLDYGHFARGYNPMAPPDSAVPGQPPAVRFLRARAGGERVVGLGVVLPPDVSMQYGLEDVRGNDPPNPDKRYFRFFQLINPSQAPGDWLAVPELSPLARRMLNLVNVRYIVTAPGPQNLDRLDLRLLYRGADANVYRDGHAVARAFVPRVVTSVPGQEVVFARLRSPTFRPGQEAVVEQTLGVRSGRGAVEFVRDHATDVQLRVNLTRRSLVVVANSFHSGWHVSVDGNERSLVRVDGILQGVVVPAGQHSVRLTYHTPGLVEGAVVSLIGIFGAGVWSSLLLVRRRRLSQHEEEADSDDGDA
jgi:Bacterial membrane protein YfhO